MPKPKDPNTTVISLAMPVALKEKVKAAAVDAGLTQTEYINSVLASALPGASDDPTLADQIRVADERSRGFVKDLAVRIKRIEEHLGL